MANRSGEVLDSSHFAMVRGLVRFRIMDILTSNPEVWKKTLFIVTYDENDGYFDHAPSFVAADPKRAETGGASAGIDTAIEYTYVEDELKQGVAEKDARSGPIGMGFVCHDYRFALESRWLGELATV